MTRDETWLLDEKYEGDASAPGFAADCARLAKGEPLAYVIGSQPFLGLTIHLDSHPLIPRVETEWWVEQLLEKASDTISETLRSATTRAGGNSVLRNRVTREPLGFLDLCAGSGAIGCALLARLSEAHVSFGEIDPSHEATILKNIRENGLDESRAAVRIGDLFAPFAGLRFDVIAANPPYIPSGRALDASVAEHEPGLALFAEEDGLALIRRLAAKLADHLAPGGEAWVEVDSEHAQAAADLFKARGLSVGIHTDQYGRPRVLLITS